MKGITIGTRGSRLALAQTNMIAEKMRQLDPSLRISVKVIKTTGDRFTEASARELAALSKGVFVKEIEEALFTGEIDLAVHSLKDMPGETPQGLEISAFPPREDPRDVLVSTQSIASWRDLPKNARIATGSARRAEQIKQLRPDFEILPLRGNVDTRIRKLRDQGLDAIVLAAAGLKRMNLEDAISCYLEPEEVVPAPGQGGLAIETRSNPGNSLPAILKGIDHPETRSAVTAERIFQARMGTGCTFPLGAYAEIQDDGVVFHYFTAYPEEDRFTSGRLSGSLDDINELAYTAVKRFKENG